MRHDDVTKGDMDQFTGSTIPQFDILEKMSKARNP
jgi:hypothetical protein